MSQLGFDKVIQQIKSGQKKLLGDLIKISQEEFAENFETESNKETGDSWKPVKREVPPPILVETGKMKDQTINGIPKIVGNTATLVIDPIDDRGRTYAAYHQQPTDSGINFGHNVEREFVGTSKETVEKHIEKITEEYNSYFNT
jgi:hypothetical protein